MSDRKHGGCYRCRSTEQEILGSRPLVGAQSVAVCDPCAEVVDRERAEAKRLDLELRRKAHAAG